MPYIVTTKKPTDDVSGLELHELPEVPSPPNVHRRAVATLGEARTDAWGMVSGRLWDNNVSAYDAAAERARNLPESGGTLGPLPDGTVIEVEPVTVRQLVAHLAGRKYQPGFEREFIDAFNAQEEAR